MESAVSVLDCSTWDVLNPINSCWLATDNATTFTGKHEGVIMNLRNHLAPDYLELNASIAHSFALVGSQPSYLSKMQNGKQIYIQSDSINI
ncbi:unnamed protein product [Adineta steineri]|uniref:Uncharacterized protein n=1 Tax=Adineta steineri TaxID=433720 RepID=A0A820GMT0_9BILA|nr:unnamed protein product [Adineta steineri]CAF4281857.1 unnamed protein product [Adineta steineri]